MTLAARCFAAEGSQVGGRILRWSSEGKHRALELLRVRPAAPVPHLPSCALSTTLCSRPRFSRFALADMRLFAPPLVQFAQAHPEVYGACTLRHLDVIDLQALCASCRALCGVTQDEALAADFKV